MDPTAEPASEAFSAADAGLLGHLYRGEVYRSTVWRSRLDQTTNWAVVTTGLALSISYSSAEASALPLILVGMLVVVFLVLEARRYRYFNVWRARCRLMEMQVYVPLLHGDGVRRDGRWNELLAGDYMRPEFHIGNALAIGRRLRKNYAWILLIQAVAYYGKLIIHPDSLTSLDQLFVRAAIGPIHGGVVVLAGVLFHGGWMCFAMATLLVDRRRRNTQKPMAIG